jgi:hypothetical protein
MVKVGAENFAVRPLGSVAEHESTSDASKLPMTNTTALEVAVPSTSLIVMVDDSTTDASFSVHVTPLVSRVTVGASFTLVIDNVLVTVTDVVLPLFTVIDKTFASTVGFDVYSTYVKDRNTDW